MIKIIEGNLFDTTASIIAHQVNCRGVMGSGVAKQVQKNYTDVFEQYKALCYANAPRNLLGMAQPCYSFYNEDNPKIIVNLFGQEDYGTDRQYTNIPALFQALCGLKHFMIGRNNPRIALPYKIGCARGGADWDKEVFPIIKLIFLDTDIDIELWKLPEGVNDNEL